MRQRAEADAIDARLRDRAKSAERHATGRFEEDAGSDGIPTSDRLAQDWRRHVVEEDDIGGGGQCDFELLEGIDLDLEGHFLTMFGTGQPDGARDHIGRPPQGGEMIVFDEDAIAEAHSVIVSATLSDGVLLEKPPSGGRLACVEDSGARSFYFTHKSGCQRCYSRKSLNKIQRHAFGAENCPRRA